MGKAAQKKAKLHHHNPLGIQFREEAAKDEGTLSVPGRREKQKKESTKKALDAKTSRKILDMAQSQQDEDSDNEESTTKPKKNASFRDSKDLENSLDLDEDDEDEEDEELDEDQDVDYGAELEVAEEDQEALNAFAPSGGETGGGRMLSDIIMKKFAEQETGADNESEGPNFDPKVVEVYTKIGQILSRYRSGPVPKAFKILPMIPAWPDLILYTEPEKWTPHAMYAAVRLFASNLKPKECQIFYREFLLPRVRDEINEDKKVSVHTYAALKKAIFKPAAFFKGILFGLCQSGTCTLKEAIILGSVLSKVKIPVEHSGAALLKLAEMEYTGPNSLFIRVLLDKKYALPYKVVDALVFHFLRFKHDKRPMPVLWHQSLLVFVQRYKADLTTEQKDALMELLRVKTHAQITPEVRREILNSVARGEEVMQEDDDAMVF